jgi:hypothetical protein
MKPKIVINASLGYSWANNTLTTFEYVKDNIRYQTYANNGRSKSLGWNVYVQWTATKSTQVMLNGSLTGIRYSNIQNYVNKGLDKIIYINVTQNLPWELILNVNGYYWGGGVSDIYSNGMEFFQYGFNLSRSFLKENRLTVKLGAQNPFSGKYQTTTQHTVNGDRIGWYKAKSLSRAFGINISYRFGSLNASVKKTNKTISNDDLQGRK